MFGFARNTRVRAGLVLVTAAGGLVLGGVLATSHLEMTHNTRPAMSYSMTHNSQPGMTHNILAMTHNGNPGSQPGMTHN